MSDLLHDRDTYVDGFAQFVAASPSSYHAADQVRQTLCAAGFHEFEETAAWPALSSGSRGFVVRDGAVIAWRAGHSVTASSPVRVLGSHTDSPGFMLKPQPDFTSDGWAQLGVEIYGGPLLNSWLDRDLALAGRIVTTAGVEHLVHTAAVARIPQLAIHLDREANTGLALDKQRHTQPVIGMGVGSAAELLADAAGLTAGEIAGVDVRLADTQLPARIGVSGELFASPRLDNLTSVYASLVALCQSEPAPGTISMIAAFDHEELGSTTRSGADGPFLEDVLSRLYAGLGADVEAQARAFAQSWCLSADAGHSVHPNYPAKHDPNVRPVAGAGPMLKMNAQQRYATDAHGAALWQRCGLAAGVATQTFVSNNTVPCGSTIGPLTSARLGIRTVDVGVPLLSMHSARELAHVDDVHALARVISAFYMGA